MRNNHKQKVYSVLDSLTKTELENYIKDRNINLKKDEMLDKLSRINKPENYKTKFANKMNDDFYKNLNSYYLFGMAYVIAFVLECFYDDKYKIKDLKEYMKSMFKDNEELKEMVYDFMKDF